MPKELVVILVAIALYVLFSAHRAWKAGGLRDISDDEFVSDFLDRYPSASPEQILATRNEVGKYFGLPARKLGVHLRVSDLSRVCAFSPSFGLAINDIIYDLHELDNRKALADISIPETIGELVHVFLQVKGK